MITLSPIDPKNFSYPIGVILNLWVYWQYWACDRNCLRGVLSDSGRSSILTHSVKLLLVYCFKRVLSKMPTMLFFTVLPLWLICEQSLYICLYFYTTFTLAEGATPFYIVPVNKKLYFVTFCSVIKLV